MQPLDSGAVAALYEAYATGASAVAAPAAETADGTA